MLYKHILPTLGYIMLAWCAFLFLLFVFQRNFLYSPNKMTMGTPASYGIKNAQTVTLKTEDGLSLKAFYMPPKTKDGAVVVIFHGNAGHIGNRAYKAQFYQDLGLGVFLLEYRGYGGNLGQPSEDGFYKDARAALDFLVREQKLSAQKLVIYGESIGTGVATEMMLHYDAAALILETPFTSIASVAKQIYHFVPVDLLLRDRYDNILKINKITAPVFIFHGTADTTVPYLEGVTLYNAANDPKDFVSIEGGGHTDLYDYTQTGRAIIGFLKNTHVLPAVPPTDKNGEDSPENTTETPDLP